MKTMNWKSNGSINDGFWKDQNEEDELDYEPVVTSNNLAFLDEISDDNLSTNFKEIPDTSHFQRNSVIDSDEELENLSCFTTRTCTDSLQNTKISTNLSICNTSNISNSYNDSKSEILIGSDCPSVDKEAVLKSRQIDADSNNLTIKVNVEQNLANLKNPVVEPVLVPVEEHNNQPKIQQTFLISTKFFDEFSSIADDDEMLSEPEFSDDESAEYSDSEKNDIQPKQAESVLFWKEKCDFKDLLAIKLSDDIFEYSPIDLSVENKVEESSEGSKANTSVTSDSVFKVPSVVNLPRRFKAKPVNEEMEVSSTGSKEDDVLSIYPSSEVSESNQEEMFMESVSMIGDQNSDSNYLIISSTNNNKNNNSNLNETRIRILNNDSIENPNSKIKSWLQTVDIDPKPVQRVLDVNPNQSNFYDVNKTVFRNCICYKHFFHKSCCDSCPRNHGQQKGKIVWTLEKADDELVKNSYLLMRHYDMVFQCYYSVFANEYITRNSLCDIITILIDSFFVQGVKPLDVFDFVVKLFEERSVMSFEDAIDYIVIQIGLNKQPLLLDIILTLIGDRKDISDDWDILKRITLGCTVELRPKLIENIIQNAISTYPMKLNTCRQIQTIIDKKLIDLSKIPAELVKALENLARFHNSNLTNQQNHLRAISSKSSNTSNSSSNNEYFGLIPSAAQSNSETGENSAQFNGFDHSPSQRNSRPSSIKINKSPIFGQLKYNSQNRLHYNLKESLKDKTEMQDSDIRSLDQIISSCNGQGFLYFLNKYRNEQSVITHFIGMTVAQLKSQKGMEIETLLRMLSIAESSDPNLLSDPKRSAIIEVISLNILVERGLVNNCSFQLLKLFPNWDTLCSSQLLGKIRLSHMGKYIYVLKILVGNNKFQLAYQMLIDDNLKLLCHSSNWPYEFTQKIDVESRNKVLDRFFENAYRNHIDLIIDMYRIVFEGRNISEYDATTHINDIFRALIEEKNISNLRKLHNHLDMFHTYLDRNVFRAYVMALFDVLSDADKFVLYEKGILKGVYKFYDGCEKEVVIRTDMHNNEIYLILKFYLRQLSLQPRKSGFQIVIQSADWSSSSFYQNNLSKNCRSVCDIVSNAINILQRDFHINVQKCDNSAYLVVNEKEVNQYFKNLY